MSANTKRHCESRLTAGSSPATFGDVAVECYSFDSSVNVLAVYDGLGNPLTASALGNRYLFQGRETSWAVHKAQTGAGPYNFRARYYDPQTGRWLSNDPIGISGGLNQYAFCTNNPVTFVDPEGMNIRKMSGHEKAYLYVGSRPDNMRVIDEIQTTLFQDREALQILETAAVGYYDGLYFVGFSDRPVWSAHWFSAFQLLYNSLAPSCD